MILFLNLLTSPNSAFLYLVRDTDIHTLLSAVIREVSSFLVNKLPSVCIEAVSYIPCRERDYYLRWGIFFESWQLVRGRYIYRLHLHTNGLPDDYTCNSHLEGRPKYQGSLSLDIPPDFQSHSLRLVPPFLHHRPRSFRICFRLVPCL